MMGQEVGQYRIVRPLGEGGMGQVFAAVDGSGRDVAIKVLRAAHAGDSQMVARFVNEARAMRLVAHPGVVTIYDVGVLSSGVPYIAMEYLAGTSLRQHMRGVGSSSAEDLELMHQIAVALAAVHSRQIIHRDLKPENILLVSDCGRLRAKVLDFGIAKLASASLAGGVRTRTGMLIGTPTYMAPEQCGGPGEVCDRTDVYALGTMLYELLAGQPPFCGEQDAQIIGRQLFMPPPPVRELLPAIDPRLEALVHRMLAKAPAERPGMVEVAAELEQLVRQQAAEPCTNPDALLGAARGPEPRSEPIAILTPPSSDLGGRGAPAYVLVLCILVSLLLGTRFSAALKTWRAHPTLTSPAGPVQKGAIVRNRKPESGNS